MHSHYQQNLWRNLPTHRTICQHITMQNLFLDEEAQIGHKLIQKHMEFTSQKLRINRLQGIIVLVCQIRNQLQENRDINIEIQPCRAVKIIKRMHLNAQSHQHHHLAKRLGNKQLWKFGALLAVGRWYLSRKALAHKQRHEQAKHGENAQNVRLSHTRIEIACISSQKLEHVQRHQWSYYQKKFTNFLC